MRVDDKGLIQLIKEAELYSWNGVAGYYSHVHADIRGERVCLDDLVPIEHQFADGREGYTTAMDEEALGNALRWADRVIIKSAECHADQVTCLARKDGHWVGKTRIELKD